MGSAYTNQTKQALSSDRLTMQGRTFIRRGEIMTQIPGSILVLAVVLVVFPVLDGIAAPLTSEFLGSTSSWMDILLDILIVPAIILGIVRVFRCKYG